MIKCRIALVVMVNLLTVVWKGGDMLNLDMSNQLFSNLNDDLTFP